MTDLVGSEFGTNMNNENLETRETAAKSTTGSDRATISLPILVPAPPLFSMTTCWPQIFESCSVTTRATMSVGPPAANGTMKRTTRLGQSSDCICTHAARPLRLSATADPVDRAIRRRRVSTVPPGYIYCIRAGTLAHSHRRGCLSPQAGY